MKVLFSNVAPKVGPDHQPEEGLNGSLALENPCFSGLISVHGSDLPEFLLPHFPKPFQERKRPGSCFTIDRAGPGRVLLLFCVQSRKPD